MIPLVFQNSPEYVLLSETLNYHINTWTYCVFQYPTGSLLSFSLGLVMSAFYTYDTMRLIADYLPLVALVQLSRTDKQIRETVLRVLDDPKWYWDSMERHFTQRLPKRIGFSALCDLLQRHDAVISGSSLTQWALGETWPGSDIDIFYVQPPKKKEDLFIKEFTEAGFRGDKDLGGSDNYFVQRGFYGPKITCMWTFTYTGEEAQVQLVLIEDHWGRKVSHKTANMFRRSTSGPRVDYDMNISGSCAMNEFDFRLVQACFDGMQIWFRHLEDIVNRKLIPSYAAKDIDFERLDKYVDRGFTYTPGPSNKRKRYDQ